ncbi:hypothetical protein CLU79DRAFT_738579 [Phycomyces nitens]|nr:hypothetical protein CLU79DRAFT_738579 [Phycomyces nitens]
MSKSEYYLGIDVGTGSARAAVIDFQGSLVSLSVEAITTWNPKHDIYEQSTADIWAGITKAVKNAVGQARLTADDIKGVGFDATCSLVVLDNKGQPRSVDIQSGFQDDALNVILWADHRAIDQARRINATKHNVLRYVGNTISPEMEIPKTLWLKENMPSAKWDDLAYIMDLPDFLTFKATGHLARSTCSLTCKCSYLPPGVGNGWDASYFEAIGLGCLVNENWKRLGGETEGGVLHAGDSVGRGLTAQAAAELGLKQGTPVGSAVIDAYAGSIATLGATTQASMQTTVVNQGSHRLAIICGTSSCHIAMSPDPIFVPGVWGPYRSVLVPDMWCAEGGQSSTGQLIDHTLSTHPAISQAREMAIKQDISVYQLLNTHLQHLQKQRHLDRLEDLTRHLHIYPDYHGNRSPLADPTLRGTIVGVSLDNSLDDLATRYLATLQAIACQTRHIIESMNQKGYTIDTLCLSGGLCKNPLFVQIHSNITHCRVILPESIEGAVVIGAAFLGARAATGQDLWDVMVRLGKAGQVIDPCQNPEWIEQDNRRYRVFLAMLEDQKKYRQIMDGTL